MAHDLQNHGLKIPDLSKVDSLTELVASCNAEYLTNGLSSLSSLPSDSVDFIWSHSVLEHIRLVEFQPTLKQLRRVLKPSGRSSHTIDLQDHLNHSLNNLRFRRSTWESALFSQSGFYTNRIPAKIIHGLFRRHGFEIIEEAFGQWPNLPISRKSLAHEFHSFSDEILINRTSSLLIK